jgi:alpha/beta hydrolase fold
MQGRCFGPVRTRDERHQRIAVGPDKYRPFHLSAGPGRPIIGNMKRVGLPGGRAATGPGTEGTRHTLTYRQYRLAYEVYGSGDRVLVWLHGLLLDANLSRGLARRLAAKGNRVVLLDLLGHGRSDKPRHAGPHRMDLYAEQVLCLLDELGVDQVVLGGVSLGTNVSLLATAQALERVHGLTPG